jgi:hypothetical protein
MTAGPVALAGLNPYQGFTDHAGGLWWPQQSTRPWAFGQARVNQTGGINYFRFQVNSGDYWWDDVNNVTLNASVERSFMKQWAGSVGSNFDGNSVLYNNGQTFWISTAFRLPAISAAPAIGPASPFPFMVLLDLHNSGSTAGTPFEHHLLPDGKTFEIIGRYGFNSSQSTETVLAAIGPGPYDETPIEVINTAPFPRDVWQYFVYELTFQDPNVGTATVNMWYNGTQILNNLATNMGYGDTGHGNQYYFQHGIYRSPTPGTTVAEYANTEVGTSSLASRVGTPLPVPV